MSLRLAALVLSLLAACEPIAPAPDLGCAQIACAQDETCASLCPGSMCVGGYCAVVGSLIEEVSQQGCGAIRNVSLEEVTIVQIGRSDPATQRAAADAAMPICRVLHCDWDPLRHLAQQVQQRTSLVVRVTLFEDEWLDVCRQVTDWQCLGFVAVAPPLRISINNFLQFIDGQHPHTIAQAGVES